MTCYVCQDGRNVTCGGLHEWPLGGSLPYLKCSPSERTVSICIPPTLLKMIARWPPSTVHKQKQDAKVSLCSEMYLRKHSGRQTGIRLINLPATYWKNPMRNLLSHAYRSVYLHASSLLHNWCCCLTRVGGLLDAVYQSSCTHKQLQAQPGSSTSPSRHAAYDIPQTLQEPLETGHKRRLF